MSHHGWRLLRLSLGMLVLCTTFLHAGDDAYDPRIWSIHYWQSLAERGLVEVAKDVTVPPPVYMGIEGTDGPDINITGTLTNTTQSENSIFVHPLDNNKLLNSNNSTNSPFSILYGTSRFESFDGGLTWPMPPGSVTGPTGSNWGDPAAAIGTNGWYYINFINTGFGQGVARSTNEGTSWTGATLAASGTLDKNHMWVDNKVGSPFEGNLYAGWTIFSGTTTYGDIEVMRSTDDGVTWVNRQAVSTAVAGASHDQGVNIQTGPNGEVYVCWSAYDAFSCPSNCDEDDIGFAKSTNGGVSFMPPTRITTLVSDLRGIRGEGSNNGGTWPVRLASFPVMAADISGMTSNIYIVFTNIGVPGVNTGLAWDIYMMRSTDGGTTWSLLPSPVNQTTPGTRRHYYPWITCDPVTGNLSCVYYTNRSATTTTSTLCEVWVSNSCDGGDTWVDNKISDVAFTPAPIPGLASGYMGDYIGVAARNDKVYPLWSDNRATPVRAYTSPFTFDLTCGGGGGIPCGDISSFVARCIAGGTIRARIIMTDATHAGEMVEFMIDGTPYPATIATGGTGVTRAQIAIGGFGAGSHTVELTDPDGCFTDVVTMCATTEKADGEWTEDELDAAVPVETALLGNYPNPFNPTTSINYSVGANSWVTLKIYNTLGEEVATLVNEFQTVGVRSATWNGTNNAGSSVASGIYVYRLAVGNVVKSEKMLFLK